MTRGQKKGDRLAWFKFDPGLFMSQTQGMPNQQAGIYIRLLNLYWTHGNRLPANPARLRRALCITTPEEEKTLDELLEEFFPVGADSERHNEELDSQLEDVFQRSAKASAAAAARYSKGSSATQPSPPKPPLLDEDDF